MSVHRLAKYQTDDPFTRVPNAAINDTNLDLKARGLLLLMLSKPDGWTFRERHLAQIAGVGRDQLRGAMQTLIAAGYVVRTRESIDGKPPTTVTKVFDRPAGVGIPEVGFSDRRETQPLSNELVRETKELNNLAAAPREEPAKKTREPDLLFESIARACNIDIGQLTGTSRGQLNKAVKELKDIGATPDQVGDKARAYRRQYENATLTPMALVKHWPSLTVKQRRNTHDEICSDCFQRLDDHDPQVHDLNAGRWR